MTYLFKANKFISQYQTPKKEPQTNKKALKFILAKMRLKILKSLKLCLKNNIKN